MREMMSNSEILDFWTEFTDSYNEWKNEVTTVTNLEWITTEALTIVNEGFLNSESNGTIISNGGIINVIQSNTTPCGIEKTKPPSIPGITDITFDEFCRDQKLTFCAYCEPMCKIHQNCKTDPVAVICNGMSRSRRMNWPLVQTCCNKCGNYQCDIPIIRNDIDCQPSLGAAHVPPSEPSKQINLPSISFTPTEENDHLLQILIPVVIVTFLLILGIAAFYFRKKRQSIKYNGLCQFEITSDSEDSVEAEDGTENSITELWDKIKNQNDEQDSIKMKPTKNNAPLACVLRSSDTSDSEV